MVALATSNYNDLFISHEMEENEGGGFVDPTIGVQIFGVLCKSH